MAPPDDREAQGKVANSARMDVAKPGAFDKAAFIKAVNDAIAAQAPKNLDEADKFSKSGKAEAIKGAVDGKVTAGKDASAHAISSTTNAPPDTSAAKAKQVTPMQADHPPGNPGAPNAADAAPQSQPAAVTDFSGGPKQTDQQMAAADVTDHQLATSNEPEFTGALKDKKTADAHSAAAPGKARAGEKQHIAEAKSGAAASGAQAMAHLTATRAAAGKAVDAGKGGAKSKDESRRAEATAALQKVFDATKKDVEGILSGLDKLVDQQFTAGEAKARAAFEADQKQRMNAYKSKRYGGWTGKLKWGKDKLLGMPKEANDLFQLSRQLYVTQMQGVISSIADTIGRELGKAKFRIATGRKQLTSEVNKLPADLRGYGQEAAKDFAGKFDGLESEVNDKSKQLVQDLATKYTKALKSVDDEIKKLQDANKGLVAKAVGAIAGVIKTIIELKNMLMGVLAKAATAIGKIIKDPIGFLNNLVHAVGAGLKLFLANIADHLKKGLVSWLLGTAVKAGLTLPASFDLKGIIQLITSLLGLTWANIRARITSKGVPDQAVTAAEKTVPIAEKLSKEGPAGAEKEIVAEVGDLKATILGKLTSYLIPTVIIAGITWILSLLNPASAFVRAVKAIIDIVTFVVTQGAQVLEFVNSVLDAVIAIANGGEAGVPKLVEGALAASIPTLLGLLASLLGIESLASKVKSVFHAVARPVNKVIDKIITFIAKKGKALWKKLKGKDPDSGKKSSARKPADGKNGKNSPSELKANFPMEGHGHSLRLGSDGLMMASALERRVEDKCRARRAQLQQQGAGSGPEYLALGRIISRNTRAMNLYEQMNRDGTNEKVKAAFAVVQQAITEYASQFGKIDIGAAAKWTPEVEAALRGHASSAESDFSSTGLSPAQIGDVERGRAEAGDGVESDSDKAPWYVRFYQHQGTVIDENFKVLARADTLLAKNDVAISPRGLPKGTKIPDFYEKSKSWWGDVTTENAWQKHLNDYSPNFGSEALAIIYQPMTYNDYARKFPEQIGKADDE
ncbi:conserved hypothetical protein [Actinacidiphila cocklensis]|uniref:Uncharacterized protein n=1 Tax=Actinacidiphila cocklensis TaxID=887465 RepID=A0A9W4GVW9_9ACTN|nr:conserved hypothetical protein [Actinacidiphila cocklensis]